MGAPPRPHNTIRLGSMCTGYGGLDLAVEAVLGPTRLEWVADPDPGASRILAHRFPDVPNLGDIRAIDWSKAAPVDVLTAGFPCQPLSMAGQRAGTDDERWLFDDITAAIGRMGARPQLLVFENVPGLLTANRGHAMARVVSGLATLGYVGSWRTLAAADIGAPHQRRRVFIVAQRAHTQRHRQRTRQHAPTPAPSSRPTDQPQRLGSPSNPHPLDASHLGHQPSPGARPITGTGTPAHSTHLGYHRPGDARNRWPQPTYRDQPASYPDGLTRPRRPQHQRGPDAHSSGRTDWGRYADAITRWEHVTGYPAPAPTAPSKTGRPQLAPVFVEWMMGLSPGWVTDIPDLSRTAQLKALGNGVVWQQAAAAIRQL